MYFRMKLNSALIYSISCLHVDTFYFNCPSIIFQSNEVGNSPQIEKELIGSLDTLEEACVRIIDDWQIQLHLGLF